jgi:putative glutamine amidotransferase
MSQKLPIIGINTSLEPDDAGGLTGIRPVYWEAVVQAGGMPVLMPQLQDPAMIEAFVDRVDAFLMVGGDDLTPPPQEGPAPATVIPVDPRRQRSDFMLLERLLARRVPTLAICLAFQELNVLHGGSLYQDLPFDGPPVLIRHYAKARGVKVTHTVTVAGESGLCRLWEGAGEALVNSCHHQAVRRLGSGLRRAAWAPDGITEAVEVEGQPFFLGVQWHPERMLGPERMMGDERQRKLFGALLQCALK